MHKTIQFIIQFKVTGFFIHFGKRYSKWPKLKLGLALLSRFPHCMPFYISLIDNFINFSYEWCLVFHLIKKWFNFTKKIIHSFNKIFFQRTNAILTRATTTPPTGFNGWTKTTSPCFCLTFVCLNYALTLYMLQNISYIVIAT